MNFPLLSSLASFGSAHLLQKLRASAGFGQKWHGGLGTGSWMGSPSNTKRSQIGSIYSFSSVPCWHNVTFISCPLCSYPSLPPFLSEDGLKNPVPLAHDKFWRFGSLKQIKKLCTLKGCRRRGRGTIYIQNKQRCKRMTCFCVKWVETAAAELQLDETALLREHLSRVKVWMIYSRVFSQTLISI